MNNSKQQNFYPITMLPMFTGQIDQLIEALEEQHKLFTKAKNSPGSLDDSIVNRSLNIFQENAAYIVCYHNQLIEWLKEASSDAQKKPLDNFTRKISQARSLNARVIDLIKELKGATINRILEKDDFELGLSALMNGKK